MIVSRSRGCNVLFICYSMCLDAWKLCTIRVLDRNCRLFSLRRQQTDENHSRILFALIYHSIVFQIGEKVNQ